MKFTQRVIILSFVAYGALFGGNSQSNALLVDSEGRILTAGLANNLIGGTQNALVGLPQNSPDRTTDFALARYLPDGRLDPTFGPEGPMPGVVQVNFQDLVSVNSELVLTPLDEVITSLAFTADNKIIAAGFASSGLNSAFAIAKLNEDGTRDLTFNATGELGPIPGIALISFGILTDVARGVTVDSQGRIVVVGSSDNGQNIDLVVVRLTPDGRLDRTFNPQSPVIGSPNFVPQAATIGADTPLFRSPGVLILRDLDGIEMLTNQGDQSASAVVVTNDDRIIVGGSLDNVNFSVDVPELNTDYVIVKLNEDGSLDQTFNTQSDTPGIVTQDFNVFDDVSFALKLDSNDRIIIGGLTNNGDLTSFGLARYTANGILDTTFNPDGENGAAPGTVITTITSTINNIEVQNPLSELRGLAIQDDNKIIATGLTDNLEDRSFVTVRYNENGTFDDTFNRLGATPGVVVTAIDPSENTLNDTAINAENEGLGVALGTGNIIYITGFSNDGLQNNFTTINYLENGDFNPAFNPTGEVSNQPGIVITKFGEAISSLGNGVPIEITEDLTGVSPSIIEDLAYPPLPIEPYIFETSLQAFSFSNRVLAGNASPNAVISVLVNDVEAAITMATKTGGWDVTLPFLADGTYKVSVVSLDPITGVSLASRPVSITVNRESLSAPVIATPEVNQRVLSEMTKLSGRAEPGALVKVAVDEKDYVEATADNDGSWTTELALPDGNHVVTAQAVNSAGNMSGLSEPVEFLVDASEQVTPKITSPRPGEMVANSTIYIKGIARPKSELTVTINDDTKTIKADHEGRWSVSLVDPSGAYIVQASQQGKTSEKVRFTVVHTKDPKEVAKGSGLLSGIAEPASRIAVYIGNNYLGSTVADATGSWSYTSSGVSKGRQLIKLLIKDSKGNLLRMLEQYITVS